MPNEEGCLIKSEYHVGTAALGCSVEQGSAAPGAKFKLSLSWALSPNSTVTDVVVLIEASGCPVQAPLERGFDRNVQSVTDFVAAPEIPYPHAMGIETFPGSE